MINPAEKMVSRSKKPNFAFSKDQPCFHVAECTNTPIISSFRETIISSRLLRAASMQVHDSCWKSFVVCAKVVSPLSIDFVRCSMTGRKVSIMVWRPKLANGIRFL